MDAEPKQAREERFDAQLAGIDAWWTEPIRHGEFEVEYPFLELPNVIGALHNAAQLPGIAKHSLRQAISNVVEPLTSGEYRDVVDRELGY